MRPTREAGQLQSTGQRAWHRWIATQPSRALAFQMMVLMRSRLQAASPRTAATVAGPYPAKALLALTTELTARQLSMVAGLAAAFSQEALSRSMMDHLCQ